MLIAFCRLALPVTPWPNALSVTHLTGAAIGVPPSAIIVSQVAWPSLKLSLKATVGVPVTPVGGALITTGVGTTVLGPVDIVSTIKLPALTITPAGGD